MQVATATIHAGTLVVEGLDLPDGETVVVLTREPDEVVHLSPELEAELVAALGQADRGETISSDELRDRLGGMR